MNLHVLRSPESENYIFSVWSVCMCVRMCVCMSVCASVISITQKRITAETMNLAFYVYIVYKCYLKYFVKMGQIFCAQEHTKEL